MAWVPEVESRKARVQLCPLLRLAKSVIAAQFSTRSSWPSSPYRYFVYLVSPAEERLWVTVEQSLWSGTQSGWMHVPPYVLSQKRNVWVTVKPDEGSTTSISPALSKGSNAE